MWNIWQAPILNFISGYYPAQYVAVHILTIATLKMSAVLWNVQTPRFWWKAMLYLSEKRNIVCSFRQDWHSIHAMVLASIFLDWLNIANPKLNLDWHRICAVLENCQYYWWVYMWDTCGIFICYDVGCTWDLKESENISMQDSLL